MGLKSIPKALLSVLPIIILLLLTVLVVLISNNNFPLIKAENLIGYPTPPVEAIANASLNQDNTYTFRLYTAKLESVEKKNYLLTPYLALTLRPVTGEGELPTTYSLALPAKLISASPNPTLPENLNSHLGQVVALQVTYNMDKAKYTFFDVKEWRFLGEIK